MPSILSVNSYHYVRGGSDAVYFNHARLLEDNGWKNTFFSMRHPNNEPCDTEEYFADRVDFDAKGGLADAVVASGRIIYSSQAQKRLSKLLDTRPVDIAHYHCIYHHLSPSVLIEAKRRGIPTVMTAHDLKLACPNYKMMNSQGVCERCKGGKVWNVAGYKCIKDNFAASALIAVESALHKATAVYRRNIDKIVAPSLFYKNKLVEWGWDERSIVYIPNFVSDLPQAPAPIGDYLLYFGRLAPEKGLKTMIKASAEAGILIKIAGSGPEEQSLKALAAELAAPVEFLGFQSGKALWSLVSGARAIILPSEWYENGPMSVIEAFALGKPLIGAAIGGIPELITEGETGWSFVPGDHKQLATLLMAASNTSSQQLRMMAEATRHLATNKFSKAAYLQAMYGLYSDLGVRFAPA